MEITDINQLIFTLKEMAAGRLPRTREESAELAFCFKDFGLETARLNYPLSETQRHRILQMRYRLEAIAEGNAVGGIAAEAQRALAVFEDLFE
jgi:hypothetical protein